ncbi:hypothetical protein ACR0ST_08870 [Aliidiomarina sp. Khilg15.8]
MHATANLAERPTDVSEPLPDYYQVLDDQPDFAEIISRLETRTPTHNLPSMETDHDAL